jgi:uroporphyrinogen-III synthase
MTLHGITVLITRQREQAPDLIRAIEEEGGRAIVCPMIRVVGPEGWGECDRVLGMMEEYEGAVFTSPNAVFWFFRRMAELKISTPGSCAVFAVGPATRASLERQGVVLEGIPSEASGEALARMLQDRKLKGERFLVPRGEIARDDVRRALEGAGAIVDSPVVYRTVAPEPEDVRRLVELTAGGLYDVVVFASPSAVKNFARGVSAEALQKLASRPKTVAIGATTGAALRELGFPVDRVAAETGTSGLVRAITQVVV